MTNKQIKNSLWGTKVYVAGKSVEIQDKLFRLGFKWANVGRVIRNVNEPYLYISENDLFSGHDMQDFYNDKNREISANQILELQLEEETLAMLIPFELKEARQPNISLMTRDGRKVRVICWDALTEDPDPVMGFNNEQPIVALVMDKNGEAEDLVTYNICGTRGHGMDFYDWELMMYYSPDPEK